MEAATDSLKNRMAKLADELEKDGQWSPRFNIVTAEDFPTSNYSWSQLGNYLIKIGSKGNKHVLLQGVEPGFWKARKYMNYIVGRDVNWSAPLSIGSSHLYRDVISLAANDSGVAFAAWINEEGKFIGRWIKPSN
jgi:hypothetical protein